MKRPIGPLGMTDEERAELGRTGKYPERTIEVSNGPLGFGHAATDLSPLTPPDLPRAGEALRDYWRLDGKIEGMREGREKGFENGKLEGRWEGRVEGREEVLREKLTELTEARHASKDAEASSNRGVGRPEGRLTAERDADAMEEIRKNNPGRNFVLLFKHSLQQDHPRMHRTSINRRAREAKRLLDDWNRSKK